MVANLSGGRVADRYTLGTLAGVGAHGSVLWEATGPDGEVAVKLIAVDSDSSGAKLLDDITAAGRVKHPAFVRPVDYGRWRGYVYVITPLLDLDALTDLLSDSPQPELALAVGRQILQALAEPHSWGEAHGNLHPANVFLDDASTPPKVLLLDMKLGGGTVDLKTEPSAAWLDCVRSLAPEQLVTGRVGPATDVYQVGVLMHRLASGRPLFPASNPDDLARLKMTARPDLSTLSRTERLYLVLTQALAARVEDRYADASEMLAALDVRRRTAQVTPVVASIPPPAVAGEADAPLQVNQRGAPPPPSTRKPSVRPSAAPPPLPEPPAEIGDEQRVVYIDAPEESGPKRWVLLVVVLLIGLLGVFLWSQRGDSSDGVPTPSKTQRAAKEAPTSVESIPAKKTVATSPPVASVQSTPKTAAPPSAVPASEPPKAAPLTADQTMVDLRSTPSGAAINLDGEFVGKTPWRARLDKGTYVVALSLPGRRTTKLNLEVDGEAVQQEVSLLRRNVRKRRTPRRAKPKPVAEVKLLSDSGNENAVSTRNRPSRQSVRLLDTAPKPRPAALPLLDDSTKKPASAVPLLGQE